MVPSESWRYKYHEGEISQAEDLVEEHPADIVGETELIIHL